MGRPALTPDHHVTVLQSDADVPAGNERDVTRLAGEALELPREPESVAFGDPAGSTDVVAGPIVLAATSRLPCERSQAVDALLGDSHTQGWPSHRKGVPNSESG